MGKDKQYLYSLRRYLAVVIVIFIVSSILGFIESSKNPESSKNFIQMFEKLVAWIKMINPPVLQAIVLLLIIFINNALKGLAAIVLGIGFGIFPLYLVAYNGNALGMVADLFSKEKGALYVLAALLPHGIIEVPMILISAGIGLRLGYVLYLSLKGAQVDIKQEFKRGIGFYVRWIVPLLFVAAVIETFITPLIASPFMT